MSDGGTWKLGLLQSSLVHGLDFLFQNRPLETQHRLAEALYTACCGLRACSGAETAYPAASNALLACVLHLRCGILDREQVDGLAISSPTAETDTNANRPMHGQEPQWNPRELAVSAPWAQHSIALRSRPPAQHCPTCLLHWSRAISAEVMASDAEGLKCEVQGRIQETTCEQAPRHSALHWLPKECNIPASQSCY